MTDLRDSWYSLVIHEAGHAVVASRLGFRLSTTEIVVDGDAYGFSGGVFVDKPAGMSNETLLDVVSVATAGDAATNLFVKGSDDFDVERFKQVSYGRDYQGAVDALALMDPQPPAEIHTQTMGEQWRRSRDILRNEWPIVVRTADGFIKRLIAVKKALEERPHPNAARLVMQFSGAELKALVAASRS